MCVCVCSGNGCQFENQISGAEFRKTKKPIGHRHGQNQHANESQPPYHEVQAYLAAQAADIPVQFSPVALLERAHLDLCMHRVKDHAGVLLVIKASKDAVDSFQVAISWAC